MRFCAILILSVISILNSLELKSQTVVTILSNGYKLERSLFLHGEKIGVYNKKGRLIKLSTDDKTRQKIFLNQSNSLTDYGIMLKYPEVIYKDACVFTYDKNNRVVKLKKEYRKHYETIEFIYETK